MKTLKSFEDLENRWGFMCEGIEDRDIRKATMQVLENSAEFMVESNYTSEDVMEEILGEATVNPNMSKADYSTRDAYVGDNVRSGAVANYVVPKVMLPVIRRVMPQLIAHELVSVQPIQGKSGVIFYAEYQYGDNKGGVVAGDEFSGNYPQDTLANRNIAGQAFYSSQKIGPFTATAPETASAAAWTYTVSDSFIKAAGEMTLLGAEAYPVAGGAAVDGLTLTSQAAGSVVVNFPAKSTGTYAASEAFVVFVKYQQEASKEIPEMQFQVKSMPVNTVERKLKVRFTREAMQDLKAHFNMDLEAELVKMASVEMNYEIDREIIGFIDKSVNTNLCYSHNWNFNGSDPVYQFLDRHRALAQSIFALAGKMAAYNRQGSANWAVISPKVAAILQMLPEFTRENISVSPNIYTIGSMSKIKYFVDPNRVGNDENTILLGFKSPVSTFGAGVVYSPYANWMTPNIFDPNTFDESKGFFSRYAMTLAPRGEWFYAKLQITNLP